MRSVVAEAVKKAVVEAVRIAVVAIVRKAVAEAVGKAVAEDVGTAVAEAVGKAAVAEGLSKPPQSALVGSALVEPAVESALLELVFGVGGGVAQ